MAASACANLATAASITNNLHHDQFTCRHMAAQNGHKRHAFGADLCSQRQQMTLFHNANANLCLHCKVTRGWPAKMSHIHQTHTLCRHMAAPTLHCRHEKNSKNKTQKMQQFIGAHNGAVPPHGGTTRHVHANPQLRVLPPSATERTALLAL